MKHIDEMEKAFDSGEDMSEYFDFDNPRLMSYTPKRVNVDLPEWMVEDIDSAAKRIGVTRQSILKMWIAEKLDELEDQQFAKAAAKRTGFSYR